MNKHLIRLVVFLLVPCLAVDPIVLAGDHSGVARLSSNPVFEDQAFALLSVWGNRLLAPTKELLAVRISTARLAQAARDNKALLAWSAVFASICTLDYYLMEQLEWGLRYPWALSFSLMPVSAVTVKVAHAIEMKMAGKTGAFAPLLALSLTYSSIVEGHVYDRLLGAVPHEQWWAAVVADLVVITPFFLDPAAMYMWERLKGKNSHAAMEETRKEAPGRLPALLILWAPFSMAANYVSHPIFSFTIFSLGVIAWTVFAIWADRVHYSSKSRLSKLLSRILDSRLYGLTLISLIFYFYWEELASTLYYFGFSKLASFAGGVFLTVMGWIAFRLWEIYRHRDHDKGRDPETRTTYKAGATWIILLAASGILWHFTLLNGIAHSGSAQPAALASFNSLGIFLPFFIVAMVAARRKDTSLADKEQLLLQQFKDMDEAGIPILLQGHLSDPSTQASALAIIQAIKDNATHYKSWADVTHGIYDELNYHPDIRRVPRTETWVTRLTGDLKSALRDAGKATSSVQTGGPDTAFPDWAVPEKRVAIPRLGPARVKNLEIRGGEQQVVFVLEGEENRNEVRISLMDPRIPEIKPLESDMPEKATALTLPEDLPDGVREKAVVPSREFGPVKVLEIQRHGDSEIRLLVRLNRAHGRGTRTLSLSDIQMPKPTPPRPKNSQGKNSIVQKTEKVWTLNDLLTSRHLPRGIKLPDEERQTLFKMLIAFARWAVEANPDILAHLHIKAQIYLNELEKENFNSALGTNWKEQEWLTFLSDRKLILLVRAARRHEGHLRTAA